MFNNNNTSGSSVNGLPGFESEISNHKTSSCCNNNNSNSILATATISNQPIRSSPAAVSQHRISIQVKVEENSASSSEDTSENQTRMNNNWQDTFNYRCNLVSDSRRYNNNIYHNIQNHCGNSNEPVAKASGTDAESHLSTIRDQVLCSGGAFLNSINSQANAQYAHYVNHDLSRRNNARDELNALSSNAFVDEEKKIYLPADPIYWNQEDTKHWIEWMVKEYSLQDYDTSQLHQLSGRDLCRLTRDDLAKLTNSHVADLLYAQLQLLKQTSTEERNKHFAFSSSWKNSESHKSYSQNLHHNSSSFKIAKNETSYKGAWSSPSSSPSQGYHHNTITGMTKPSALDAHTHPHLRNMQDPYQMFGPASSRLASSGSGQIQLWQFLLELLSDSGNANCITWEGTNGEFKLTDPDEVARRWGERKSKPNMNYDKLSRALRYYYDKNIMTKVHGKRYAYKFDFQGLAQATQPTAADPSAYKAAYQSADLFMHPPPGYPHPSSAAKHLNFAAAVHGAGIAPSSSASIFPSATSYWTNPGAAANLYSNIAAASATHHSMPHHHHPGHVTSHIGSYAHYA